MLTCLPPARLVCFLTTCFFVVATTPDPRCTLYDCTLSCNQADMKFSAVALFAVALGIAAAVLPALATPILYAAALPREREM